MKFRIMIKVFHISVFLIFSNTLYFTINFVYFVAALFHFICRWNLCTALKFTMNCCLFELIFLMNCKSHAIIIFLQKVHAVVSCEDNYDFYKTLFETIGISQPIALGNCLGSTAIGCLMMIVRCWEFSQEKCLAWLMDRTHQTFNGKPLLFTMTLFSDEVAFYISFIESLSEFDPLEMAHTF